MLTMAGITILQQYALKLITMSTVKQILVYGLVVTAGIAYGQPRTRSVITPYGHVNMKVYDGKYVYQTQASGDTSMALINGLIDQPAMKAQKSKLFGVGFLSIYTPATRPHIYNTFDLIRHDPKFGFIGAVLIHPDGTQQGISNRISVMLKPTTTRTQFRAILKKVKTDSVVQSPFADRKSWYTIYVNKFNKEDALDVANRLNKSRLFRFADVDWIRVAKLRGLNGSQKTQWGQANMHLSEAWKMATGKNIKVAVLDDGVDLLHPDLKANLEQGYDATGNGAGAPNPGDGHGTACAGIIAALNNDFGTVGVAYNARLIPVKIGAEDHHTNELITVDAQIGAGIHWAVEEGKADILSCSWVGGLPDGRTIYELQQAMIPSAHRRAVIIVFAAGNDNVNYMLFPADLPGVVAVGASTACDTRQTGDQCDEENWGSNYGDPLAVLAPGVQIETTAIQSQYTSGFSGTSAACPQVAGVFALMLEAKPTLTAAQAIWILEHSADAVGNYTYVTNAAHPVKPWCADAGYGRVNADSAVIAASRFVPASFQLLKRRAPALKFFSKPHLIHKPSK